MDLNIIGVEKLLFVVGSTTLAVLIICCLSSFD